MNADAAPESGSQERETFEIEGIGGVRARVGTSVHDLAGAAHYWQSQYKRLEKKVSESYSRAWYAGFGVGAVSVLVGMGIVMTIRSLL